MVYSPWATAPTNISAIPAPAAASGLTVGVASSTRLALKWTAPSSTATSQTIQRSTDDVNFTTVAVVAPLLTTYVDNGLTTGVAYTYRVITGNTTGSATVSNTAVATPPAYQAPSRRPA